MMLSPAVRSLVDLAIEEDLGRGDVTTEALVDRHIRASAYVLAKQELVLFGLDLFTYVFECVSRDLVFHTYRADGDLLAVGDRPLVVEGPAWALLAGERTALNFLQRLSGVATLTRRFVDAARGTETRIVDTRKTTPGWRALEKAAVRAGGGCNHRADLASGILIKDNHVVAAGGVAQALERARKHAPHTARLEVEVKTFAELDEALRARADIILLDNMSLEDCKRALERIDGRARVEVSGGITLDRVRSLAELGVDFVSAGALTHSAPAVDLSLELEL